MTFEQYLSYGRIGEGIIAKWLHSKGYNVLPVYDKELGSGKGPAVYAIKGPLTAPDIFAFRSRGDGGQRQAFWCEAKTKSAFAYHRNSRSWHTGIDKRLFLDYLRVQETSPWPVWLMFLHLDGQAKDSTKTPDTGLFGAWITTLRDNIHQEWNDGRRAMVYWAHPGVLRKLATLDELKALVDVNIAALPNGGWGHGATSSRNWRK